MTYTHGIQDKPLSILQSSAWPSKFNSYIYDNKNILNKNFSDFYSVDFDNFNPTLKFIVVFAYFIHEFKIYPSAKAKVDFIWWNTAPNFNA